MNYQTQSTDEFMVIQMTGALSVLQTCSKHDLAKLKKEIAEVMGIGMMGPPIRTVVTGKCNS